jgi:hypothetical protein
MVVRLDGLSHEGRSLRLEWHLSADRNHGPEIPCMPAILLARTLARAAPVPIGAHVCMGLTSLQDYTPEFERWGMRVRTRTIEDNEGMTAR